MNQNWNQPQTRPWYLDEEGRPFPMDQMMPMMYQGGMRGFGMSEMPVYPNQFWTMPTEDMRYVQELTDWQKRYPEKIKRLQKYVEEACDRLDYDGSMIYDEQPDTLAIQQLSDSIVKRVQEEMPSWEDSVFQEDSVETFGQSAKQEMGQMAAEEQALYESGVEMAEFGSSDCPNCGRNRPSHPHRPPHHPQPPRPPRPPKHHRPPRDDGGWIQNIIPVLLFQEIYKKRCNKRNCRRRFY